MIGNIQETEPLLEPPLMYWSLGTTKSNNQEQSSLEKDIAVWQSLCEQHSSWDLYTVNWELAFKKGISFVFGSGNCVVHLPTTKE